MNKINWLSITCTLSFCVALSAPALADQCSYISKEQALNAISRLDIDRTIYFLCEPCGEKIPQSAKIKNLSMEKVDYRDFWQVKVNDRGIDLAYVFVDSGIKNNFINLAAIADCPAQLVSPVLPIEAVRDSKGKETKRDYHGANRSSNS